MVQGRLNPLARRLFRAPTWLYRWRCGWLLGHRFLLLIHTGRRSGLRHRTVLEVMAYRPDGPEMIVMSGFGPRADWLRNIQANPNPEVMVGSLSFSAAYRVLDIEEAIAVIASYERRNRFAAPVIRLVLGRLLGSPYHGSEADHRQAATNLPLIAFRPRNAGN
jgi:deazaflavin-dependent oxidoreductase (nitroreductase family)